MFGTTDETRARSIRRHVLANGYVLAWLWTPEGAYWHIYRPNQMQHSAATGTYAEALRWVLTQTA